MSDTENAYFIGRTDNGMVSIAWYDGNDLRDPHAVDATRARNLADDLKEWADRIEADTDE